MHSNGKHHTDEAKASISEHNTGRYRGGELLYKPELIKQLRLEYKQLKTKRAVNKLHPDINYISLCNLINYGSSQSINHTKHNIAYNEKRGK